jgi:PAS domain S-box-containing protein
MTQESRRFPFLTEGGIAGELARSVDWAKTPLGPPDDWPQSLKTIVGVILQSRHPMFLWWGPELIQVYNDAYLPSFGAGKHPAAMGQPGRDCWQEIWPIIWPQIDDVMSGRRSSWNEDHLVPIFRNGRLEEVYWTYGYSPVLDDRGGVGGVLVVCTETTSRVISDRRSRTLRALVERTAPTTDAVVMLDEAVDVLRDAAEDIPCALVYGRDARTERLRLTHSVGLEDPAPADAALRAALGEDWAAAGERRERVLPSRAPLPGGVWPEPATAFFLAPLRSSTAEGPRGLIAFGLSPRLPCDERYLNHLEQIASHLGLAQARIDAYRIRLAAEHERNNLLLQAPVATALLTGPEHLFEVANQRYCQIVGRSDLVGKTYLQAFPELRGTEVPRILDRVYQTGESFCTEEQLIRLDRRGDGTIEDCFYQFNLEALRAPEGDIYGMMAIAIDITEQVRSRQVLERAHDEREKLLAELEAASRAKDEFLAMLGHELRNPLSPIATALQLMRMRGETRTAREQAVIERQVTHLTRLVDDLLDVSRITRGKVELRKETVDVADVIARAVELASDLFEQRHHELSVDVPRGRLHVQADPVRLAQVVTNLLTNAARYTEPGGRIRVTGYGEGDEVVIRIQDNGMGIPAELLPRLFDLFVQGKRSADRSQGGLGIGLTLVKNLVALHGGTVATLSDGPGRGAELVIRLPALEPAQLSTADPGTAEPHEREAPRGRRVLVVDDNGDAADTLAEVLRAAGHEVSVAYDPVAALEVVGAFGPEVAILDLGLPVMDGYELAARLRASQGSEGCRLIALSGYGQPHDRARSQAGGFQHHLVKPVDLGRLTRLVSGEE